MRKLLKIIVSALISFALLNGICFFYYNVPVHSESETRSTDYVWEKGKFYSRGTEGFAWGKTDANGFNNLSAENSISPDILVMGTSHTEAFNVSQTENYSYLLRENIRSKGVDMSVYNIGISGHRITTCLSNFQNAIDEFKPDKYVVMEITTTEMTLNEINQISEGMVKKLHSTANPILVFLQKIPFVRCVYSQIDKMSDAKDDAKDDAPPNSEGQVSSKVPVTDKEYESALNALMKQISDVAKENGVKLILFFNSNLNIDKNGIVIPSEKSEKSKTFESVCRDNEIILVDMYTSFADYYNGNHRLPHGFSNTAVGVGHLNKYGHEVVANELGKLIVDFEKQTSVEA